MSDFYVECLSRVPAELRPELVKQWEPTAADIEGCTPLVAAIRLDLVELVDWMLENGFSSRDVSYICSPLGAAISSSRPCAAKILKALLIRHGPFEQPEHHYCGELNEPMLHFAIRHGKSEMVKLLVDFGYKAEWRDEDGLSAYDLAAQLNNGTLKLLAKDG